MQEESGEERGREKAIEWEGERKEGVPMHPVSPVPAVPLGQGPQVAFPVVPSHVAL